MPKVEVDGAVYYVSEGEAEKIERIESLLSAIPYDDPAEAMGIWMDLADFRRGNAKKLVCIAQAATVRLIEERRIDFSKYLHQIFAARFGKHRGEKFATAFDYLIKTFETY